MSIAVDCDRVDCGAAVDIGEDGLWDEAPGIVAGYGPTIAISLPEGWAVDRVGMDAVIHCPKHAG